MLQKSEFHKLSSKIAACLNNLSTIQISKQKFYQKHKNNINKLFNLFTDYPTISSKDLLNIIDQNCIKMLIQNKKHMTINDVYCYLGINQKNIEIDRKQKDSKNNQKLQLQTRFEFEDIVSQEVEEMQKMRYCFKNVALDLIFSQIDFFSHGYIDASSLAQFVKHYSSSQSQVNQQQMQSIFTNAIKYFKSSTTAHKIFYQDFVSIIQQQQNSQNPEIINHNNQPQRQIGHIAKVSDIQLMQSRTRRQKTQQSSRISYDKHDYIIGSSEMNGLSRIQTQSQRLCKKVSQKNLQKIKNDMKGYPQNYQEQICTNHWRNAKYLQKLKVQMNISHFKNKTQANQILQHHDKTIKPHNSINSSNAMSRKAHQRYMSSFSNGGDQTKAMPQINPSQILYQMRYISQLYHKFRILIQNFFKQNPGFAIINGFNVIDVKDKGFVTFKQLKQFLFETETVLHQSKIQTFFNALSQKQSDDPKSPKVIHYPNFACKVFKIKITQNLFDKQRKRRPLILQEWPQQQKKNYCRYIRSVASIFDEIISSKTKLFEMFQIEKVKAMKKTQNEMFAYMNNKMEEIFSQTDIHYEKLREILGKNSQAIISEIYADQTILEPQTFYKFIASTI